MQLKEYQERVLGEFTTYLDELRVAKGKIDQLRAVDPDLAVGQDMAMLAWRKVKDQQNFQTNTNGLGESLPAVGFKVPTGGGKTLLACYSIDLIQHRLLQKQTGVVLWIVPSTEIYKQTIRRLRDRNDPYRQVLDRSSGGRTMIVEKGDRLTKQDTEVKLVVIMLMLQSSNRENKETLKMYQLSGGYEGFFPAEDQYDKHQELLQQFPNLDTIGSEDDFFGELVTYSFGNVLRMLQPVVILDEGHKAYSEKARSTLESFNPKFLLELSATPPKECNVLVEVSGRDLDKEEMIKLDIHLENRMDDDWKLVLLAGVKRRQELEEYAVEYAQNNGRYIRPIQLIQAERTGKDQRGNGFIHSEDVKEYLVRQCSIPESQIAIKSSDKDELSGQDLLSAASEVRYIITKSALQEGWDCSFAYVLSILTNPASKTALTQLIGRILRQPYAAKTGIKTLDECYVYTFKRNAQDLVKSVKKGLEMDGMQDLNSSVSVISDGEATQEVQEIVSRIREKYKEYEGKVFLPKFVIQEGEGSSDVSYEQHILSRLEWSKLTVDFVKDISLSHQIGEQTSLAIGLEEVAIENQTEFATVSRTMRVDTVFIAKQLSGVVPNPWIAYELSKQIVTLLRQKYSSPEINQNIVHIIEQVKLDLIKQIEVLAYECFQGLIASDQVRFLLLSSQGGYTLPKTIKTHHTNPLRNSNQQYKEVSMSLFDFVPDEDLNTLEKSVALTLENQEKLLWWHRNLVGKEHYSIQGWRKNKVYADFIFLKKPEEFGNHPKVYVLETKGLHLDNQDTKYKQDLFALCTKQGIQKEWQELRQEEFGGSEIEFQVIFDDQTKNSLHKIFE